LSNAIFPCLLNRSISVKTWMLTPLKLSILPLINKGFSSM
jgi:hypothetical protein